MTNSTNDCLDFYLLASFYKMVLSEAENIGFNLSLTQSIKGIQVSKLPNNKFSIIGPDKKSATIDNPRKVCLFNETIGEINKIIRSCRERNLEVSFIELCVFDPLDITGRNYYYLHSGALQQHLDKYIEQCNKSIIEQEIKSLTVSKKKLRGHLLPSIGLFRKSYFCAQYIGRLPILSSNLNKSNFNVGEFILSEDLSDISDEHGLTKYHAKNFLKDVLKDFLETNNSINEEFMSYGLILPILRPSGRRNEYGNTEEKNSNEEMNYRGGVLLIFGSSKNKRFNFDKLVLKIKGDLLDKAVMRAAINELSVQKEISSSFGHEIKQMIGNLSGSWLLEIDSLFDIVPSTSHPISPGKIGKIEVWQPELLDQLYVAPFRQFLQTAYSLTALWTGQHKNDELPFEIGSGITSITLREMIEKLWHFSVEVIAISELHNTGLADINDVKEAKQKYASICNTYSLPILEISYDVSNTRLDLQEKNKENPFLMDMARLLSCIFSNTLKHLDTSKPYRISVKRLSEEKEFIELSLTNHAIQNKTQISTDNIYSVQKFGTKEVMESLLKPFSGKLIRFGYEGGEDETLFMTTILFKLPTK